MRGFSITPELNNAAVNKFFTLAVLAVSLLIMGGAGAAAALSGNYIINIDPHSRKSLGEETVQGVMKFFHDSEKAIEEKNLDALMDLYSDGYKNGDNDKAAVREIWKRIFSRFGKMATMHNMRFITTSPESNVMIIRCSGLLMGVPTGESEMITIDTWTNNDHILTKEDGKWKLVGSSGKEMKRFWFDKPLHPLF